MEFKKFVKMLCPGYTLPSRKTLSNSLIPQTFTKIRESVKQEMNKAYALCITTDSWTSINIENFTAITAHWLDDSHEHGALTLCSNLLNCIAFNDRHTAIDLCSLLQDKFEEWEIQDKILVIISDNAHNIIAAIKKGNWHWEIANQAIEILQVFSDVTVKISAEENVSISKIPLFVTAMDTQFTNATLNSNIHKMVDVFLKEIQERFRNIESNDLVAQTVILNPRFKKYGFKDQLKANQSIQMIKQKLLATSKPNLLLSVPHERVENIPFEQGNRLWIAFDEKVREPHNPTAAVTLEVDKYISEPLIGREEDPLLWWFQRKNVYPKLYELVKKRSCIVVYVL
ncbi:unnamed protein product [Diabrotica balteata]|uniref:HAT C-terminal dimerisation domain-containing protein n=1 Tax=Diabrotica balteata TaxID=107213 RepID=A0A9N9TG19_DIABA|nr:unnamed protein product [Diabrotica balteata]